MGKNFRTPQKLIYERGFDEKDTSQLIMEYIIRLRNRLNRCQDLAMTRREEYQQKRKAWFNRKPVERKFFGRRPCNGDKISKKNYVIDLHGKRDHRTI
ncbi:hypothetical protein NPIL_41331 [Nephila pilipes]|uniref:Uncharacterized protein n=1 Tax=Nephila pilipes TaxID=299642 RepID=A0A8X6Q4U6_NEPPI|nr:hypothetical protein NPIL_41331 [Nephila pilipes]